MLDLHRSLREYETVRAAAPLLKPGWKWNRFQKANGGAEGDGGGQGVGDGEDSAGRDRRAFEDDLTTAWGAVGGVASGGGGVSRNGRYIKVTHRQSVGKYDECRERQRHSFLQSVWLVVFDAAQCLEAELLQ